MTLKKTLDVTGPMHGCLTLTAANGDTLTATYDGTEDLVQAPNALRVPVRYGNTHVHGRNGPVPGRERDSEIHGVVFEYRDGDVIYSRERFVSEVTGQADYGIGIRYRLRWAVPR